MTRGMQRALFILVVLFVLVPLLMPVVFSFSTLWQEILPEGFTTRWYRLIFGNPRYRPAVIVSLIVSLGAVLIDVVTCVPAAYAINRLGGRLARTLGGIFNILPLVFPPLIVGLALIQSFNAPPLALSGTLGMVVIAHALIGFPFMFRNVLAAFRIIDERTLSEAAASLGATLGQRIRYVLIPNVMPGILAGSLLVFANSIGEFEVTSMVAGFGTQTMPLLLFQNLRDDFRIASAVSALLVYTSVLSLLGITYVGMRLRGRSSTGREV